MPNGPLPGDPAPWALESKASSATPQPALLSLRSHATSFEKPSRMPRTASPSDYLPCSSGVRPQSPQQAGPHEARSPHPHVVGPRDQQRAHSCPRPPTPAPLARHAELPVSSCEQLRGFRQQRDGGPHAPGRSRDVSPLPCLGRGLFRSVAGEPGSPVSQGFRAW